MKKVLSMTLLILMMTIAAAIVSEIARGVRVRNLRGIQKDLVANDLRNIRAEMLTYFDQYGRHLNGPEETRKFMANIRTNEPIESYVLDPDPGRSQPMVQYVGQLKYARGLAILKNGGLVKGKADTESDERGSPKK